MTEKRFSVYKSPLTHLFVVNDNTHEFNFQGVESASTIMKLVGLLNNYIEENKELKQSISDWQGSYDELNDENQRLKRDNETLKVYLEQANSTDKECDYE